MECEFSVELGADDPTLAVPWRSPDGSVGFVDLRFDSSMIVELSEVKEFPELGEFLRALNSGEFATAKCDVWFDTLMDVDDEPYEAAMKCASYVDVYFAGARLASFEEHELRARAVVKRVRAAEEIRGRAEVVVRRAWFGEDEGFYWTVYLTGYGEDSDSSRQQWAKAMRVVEKALS
ncbi:hypothetical protein Acid345_1011 [Candidatus Koribacter versatilis Ellin345]|uniref:Uncharacterized protein n=1 Tax=Koribacter versatilis (strain Ellin345) TaxID=204669 RepID=Q1ISY6_KORVE|nr:hypothetical protein [Candidatus Koribacter versatilis]ABF40014.1 hypothetical protein Acid345_1011 [Candidatus Koribacter versatilis Ellin345]